MERVAEDGEPSMMLQMISEDEEELSSPGSGFAPEMKLTLFALRLAILEKAASRLGALGFVWATVVLLGGFAITLSNKDFWVITVILLVESARIFSRSHELEWQHQSSYSFPLLRKPSALNLQRTWESNNVPLLPYLRWFFLSKNMSRILYWLQIVSAMVCVFLSLERLINQDFGEMEKCGADKRNRKAALCVFYSTALAEAVLFLGEKAYWAWKINFCNILLRVGEECGFGILGKVYMRRFFYDAYTMCINGSIFDGIKTDLISFAEDLLCSSSDDEQLMGARIIQTFARNERLAYETLHKVSRSEKMIKRLLEMLNWKNPNEKEIRRLAAEIVCKLAGKKQNALPLSTIPGAMESISSLLEVSYLDLNLMGLLILNELARDHHNCGEIGNTRGLLSRIISFTGDDGENPTKDGELAATQMAVLRHSLELVKRLARSTGSMGEQLRKEISENVFIISNIREIMQYGEKKSALQKLGVHILMSLATEEQGRERIGGTGGMINQLFRIFLDRTIEAGKALAVLTMDNPENCRRMIRLGVVDRLVGVLSDSVLKVGSAWIIRNLCAYGGADSWDQLSGVLLSAVPTILNAAMEDEEKLLEASIGLTTQIIRFSSPDEQKRGFQAAGVTESRLAERIVSTLERYDRPSLEVPRMRRFAIELSIWMMRSNPETILLFERCGMKGQLLRVVQTTSELESFRILSGSVGISRHTTSVVSLAETAMDLLSRDNNV